ncbi:AbiH family protein [Chryseobacterium sp. MP_3.2]|uniref:AbiH family protein n=1 Tax=Chryseobacterium sp. MP_3.2 TaxID=3071712 RepID=UPI002DFC8C27|nr:hypothetical protein [Chryseobacterium sp. MP_3.2]
MEKIVIIGNGFDLRHYLPTKYNHLITILREIENLNFSSFDEIKFGDLFGNLFKEKDIWFHNNICEYYNTNNILFDKTSLESIQVRIKNNNWFKYLKTVEDSKIETWIDFETEIERVLIIILDFFTRYNLGELQNGLKRDGKKGNVVFYVHGQEYQKVFKNKLQSNILLNFNLFKIENNFNAIADNTFLLIVEDELQYFKEKKFFDSVYYSLEEFIGVFNDYIINIVNAFYSQFNENLKENYVHRDDKFLFDVVSQVFSFNYTSTIGQLYKHNDQNKNAIRIMHNSLASKKTSVDYLHGEAISNLEKLDELKIVLGVDDINNNLKNHKLFQFTKYFQKLHKNTDYLFLDQIIRDLDQDYKGKEDKTFYFWGHSLDISDSEYIRDVFKVVRKSDCQIIIFYHSISGKADQLKNLLSIIDKNIIEDLMKNQKLTFIESTFDNLFEQLS